LSSWILWSQIHKTLYSITMLQTILVKKSRHERRKINNYSHLGHVGWKQFLRRESTRREENVLFFGSGTINMPVNVSLRTLSLLSLMDCDATNRFNWIRALTLFDQKSSNFRAKNIIFLCVLLRKTELGQCDEPKLFNLRFCVIFLKILFVFRCYFKFDFHCVHDQYPSTFWSLVFPRKFVKAFYVIRLRFVWSKYDVYNFSFLVSK
jgi:hypothetical protein